MRKKFFILYILLALFIINSSANFAAEDLQLRDYTPIVIPQGTFVQVVNLQEVSTAYCDDTTKVKFAAADDTYLYDTNIIPKGTVILGEVEKMNEPIVGTNASMMIKLTKLQLADGFEIPIKAYVATTNGSIVLGGDRTEPKSYKRLPHYQEGLHKGTLMWVPGPELKMGEHLTLPAGTMMLMIFNAPAYITHTLTN